MEKAIGIARMIGEIKHGKKNRGFQSIPTLPIHCITDSKTLHESIYSTKQIQEVSIRILIAWIKEQLNDGIVKDVSWTDTKSMIADILTKKNVNAKNFIEMLKQNENKENIVRKETKVQILFMDQVMNQKTVDIPIDMPFQEIRCIHLNDSQNKAPLRLLYEGERVQDHETP